MRTDIVAEILATSRDYHALLDSFSTTTLKRRSHNPGWSNKEILFHMLLGFIVVSILFPMVKVFARLPNSFSQVFAGLLNLGTPLFNIVNAMGARAGGRIVKTSSLHSQFDRVTQDLVTKAIRLKKNEWEEGMHFPDRWDGLFKKYMTFDDLFRYPLKHFRFHRKQLSR